MLNFSITEINFDYRKNIRTLSTRSGRAVRYRSPRARQRGVNTGRRHHE